MILYEVWCDYYTDTRMGASNPYFKIGDTVRDLEGCKKEILKYFKKQRRTIDKNFEIKNKNWSHDFRPEILSIKEIKVK